MVSNPDLTQNIPRQFSLATVLINYKDHVMMMLGFGNMFTVLIAIVLSWTNIN